MSDKNIKKTQKPPVAKEDIQFYRLLAIFGAAILGFAALRLVNESKLRYILGVGQWIAAVILIAVVAGLIYLHCVKKIDESNRVFTSIGVAYFLIPVLLICVTYRHIHNANVKYQVAFAMLSLFAVIYNVFKREFKNISALAIAEAFFLYYASANTYNTFETVLAYISKVLVFVVPVMVIALLVLAMRAKNGAVAISGKEIYRLPSKIGGILALVMAASLLIAGVLLAFLPAAFVYVMIALLVIYILIGIVCTIRLI